ncbi:MAG: hypothetical protein WAU64_09375 [Methanoregula sp.]|uniref:hypothetical protein n=1 Tax=Methanoregula sp. TaxID=2052170 RepID=UPI003BAF5FA2
MKMENPKTFFDIGALIAILIIFIAAAGCASENKISKDEAIHVALTDTRTIQAINNSAYNVSEVSTANLGVGTQTQNEVYYISIKVLDGSNRRVNVFVTYDGKVALVDIPYPVITPLHYPANNS